MLPLIPALTFHPGAGKAPLGVLVGSEGIALEPHIPLLPPGRRACVKAFLLVKKKKDQFQISSGQFRSGQVR